jgi:hypothetical protein
MKRILKSKLEIVLLLSLALMIFSMVVFFNQVIIVISLFVYAQWIPYNVVFAPGINYNDYDGSVILNCLHGGGCPEGVTFVNDETGQVESREVVPKKSQPVQDFSPESTGFPDSYNPNPSILNPVLNNVILIDYFIYGLIIILLIGILIFLLKRRSKKPKAV